MTTRVRTIAAWRGLLLAATLAGIIPFEGSRAQDAMATVPPVSAPPAASARVYDFDIPGQSLVAALEQFNKVTGIEIFYDARLVAGRISSDAVGRMTAPQALDRLLAESSLGRVVTNTGMISLILQPDDPTILTAAPVAGPILQLNTLHVVSPVPAYDHRYYATAVAYAVQGALQRDAVLRHVNYRADINVWLSRTGEVLHLEFLSGSGDQYRAIADRLKRLPIGMAPPLDLEQPVRINIHASGAR